MQKKKKNIRLALVDNNQNYYRRVLDEIYRRFNKIGDTNYSETMKFVVDDYAKRNNITVGELTESEM